MEAELWNKSLNLLAEQDFEQGWPKHHFIRSGKATFRNAFEITPTYNLPVWQGEPDVSLLANADFGIGDTIQFARFLPLVTQRVKKVILRCDEDLHTLLKQVVGETIKKDDPIPEIDRIIHLMAIPGVLGIKKEDIEADKRAYLFPTAENHILDLAKFTKIGVCWAGNPFHPRDASRSIPYDLVESIFPSDEMRMFNLDKIRQRRGRWWDVQGWMRNWEETANLISRLDLVISVDTAMAHLAGAMGKPVWLLLAGDQRDWRWRVGNENKPIWYDSMRIIEGPDWLSVLNQTRHMLLNL